MTKWHMLRKRSYVLVAVLAITMVAGTVSSTAYAMFRGPEVRAQNFNVTYVGVTGPIDSLTPGLTDLVLTQASGEFVGGRRSQMSVYLEYNDFMGARISTRGPCKVPSPRMDFEAWCIDEGRMSWAVAPLRLLRDVQVGEVQTMWGPSYVMQVIDGEGYEGFATYRATVEKPSDAATEGAIVIVNIDGFVRKVKTSKDAHELHSFDD